MCILHIPFYFNLQALSMLLRTVHSILKRTPPELLSEIIMVNDNSPNEDLQEILETYVRYLPTKVIILLHFIQCSIFSISFYFSAVKNFRFYN